MAARLCPAGDVGELHVERRSIEGGDDPVDRTREEIGFERIPAHLFAERYTTYHLLQQRRKRLGRGLPADSLLDDHSIVLDFQRIQRDARFARESGARGFRRFRRRPDQLARRVGRFFRDGRHDHRQPARRRVRRDVRPLRLALAVQARVVEPLVDLGGQVIERRLLKAGRQLFTTDFKNEIHYSVSSA